MPEQDPVLVDTDVASALYLERYYGRRVSASLARSLAPRQLAVSLITLGEAHYGARKRKWGPPRTSRMLAVAVASPHIPLRRRNVQLWQQNTSTRRLTEDMLDGVFLRARQLLEGVRNRV